MILCGYLGFSEGFWGDVKLEALDRELSNVPRGAEKAYKIRLEGEPPDDDEGLGVRTPRQPEYQVIAGRAHLRKQRNA